MPARRPVGKVLGPKSAQSAGLKYRGSVPLLVPGHGPPPAATGMVYRLAGRRTSKDGAVIGRDYLVPVSPQILAR